MLDVDTFLNRTLHVMVDDSRHSRSPKKEGRPPGADASLSDSGVLTLAVFFSRWSRFTSERDYFYRYAMDHLKDAFPTLPERSQFNRLARSRRGLVGKRWPRIWRW